MAVTNLGMGLSGFGVLRPDSSVVKSQQEYSNDYDTWLKGAQGALQTAGDGYNNGLQQQKLYGNAYDAINQQLLSNGFSQSQIAPNVILQGMANTGVGAGWNSDVTAAANAALPNYEDPNQLMADMEQARQNIATAQNNLTTGQQQWQTQRDQYVNNQAASQQAYNQQNGVNFTGGLLNNSYANPFGNTVTGSATPAAGANGATSFNAGLMGQGGTTAAPSTGLAPTNTYTNPWAAPMGSAQQSQGASAWGGPFSAKNPWSLS